MDDDFMEVPRRRIWIFFEPLFECRGRDFDLTGEARDRLSRLMKNNYGLGL